MSLLCQRERRATIDTILKRTDGLTSDNIFLSKNVWDALTSSNESPIFVSLQSTQGHTGLPDSFDSWAQLDPELDGLSVAVPSFFFDVYPYLLSPANSDHFCVTPAVPTCLEEVILDALSPAAYQLAIGHPQAFRSALAAGRRILRLGHIHELPLEKDIKELSFNPVQYRICMVTPTTCGYAHPDSTRIIVTRSEGTAPGLPFINGSPQLETEKIEIDEGFLANAIIPSRLNINGLCQYNDREPHLHSLEEVQLNQTTFTIDVLEGPASSFDDHCTLYIRTADLGRVGLLNQDWAVASSYPESHYRLVRVIAHDQLVQRVGMIRGDPVLVSNILGSVDRNLTTPPPLLSLRPSPFGNHAPAIPTAKSVTIARVATPVSINRQYQSTFLDFLKNYLASTKRLVKANDFIAIPLCSDDFPFNHEEDEDQSLGDHSTAKVNEIVYFIVTNVEYDIVSTSTSNSDQDLYMGSAVGELGCWIDSNLTRIMQTGVEHARVPDTGRYYELDVQNPRTTFAFLRRLPYSHLLRQESLYSKLLSLISASFTRRAVDYHLELSILLKGTRGVGKFSTISWVAQALGMHILEIDCFKLVGENDAKTEGTLRIRFEQAATCSPCILVLRNIEALVQTTQNVERGKDATIGNILKECISESAQSWRMTGFPVVIAATTGDPSQVPIGILSSFKHDIEFQAPNEDERLEILQGLSRAVSLSPDVSLKDLATQTAALVSTDLSDLMIHAKSSSLEQRQHFSSRAEILLTADDFEKALKKVRSTYSENIGAPRIPNVTWDDVGGLAHVKAEILDTIQLPLEHPELFADGLKKRSGILLYGPPGTGKTLVAKAVATSCSLNFFSVKGPELLNMYIGESEANVRRVFQRARDAKPCVIFFDELDSVAPKRGNHGDSGGVMDRIVSQLLAEIDGMSNGGSGADVFVIGATNRPDLLDSALLRPGRFDRMLYLGVSQNHAAQLKILEALTRKFKLHPDLDLKEIAERCPFNYTGADFYALCSDAMLHAMSRTAQKVEEIIADLNEKHEFRDHPYPLTAQYYLAEMAKPDDIEVSVSKEDFLRALEDLVPSVSHSEMEHYTRVQQKFSQAVITTDV